MPTLTGFNRPSDPIDTNTLLASISSALGVTIDSVIITPTDVQVAGNTLSETNRSAIQTVVSAYYYPNTQTGVPITDNPSMAPGRHNMAVTEYAAYTADMAVLSQAQRGAYINGVFVVGITPYIMTGTTNTSGIVTVYATNDGTATGTAVFSTIPSGGITATPIGSASNYQVTAIAVSTDKKTITITVNQLGSVVLGLVNVTSAAANVAVSVVVWGK